MVVNNIKLIFNYFKLNVKKEWQYKPAFFMQVVMMVLNDLFLIIQWAVVFGIVDNIGGYDFYDTITLFALSAGSFGFAHTFFCGAWNLKEFVYNGKLDVYLTQPKSLLLNVCCSSTDIGAIGDMIYAFIILVITGAPWYHYLLMIPAIIMGGIIITAVYVSYASLCFYIKGGDAMAKSVDSTILKAANYPKAIFNQSAKYLLLTIMPAFFVTTIPFESFFMNFNIYGILLMLIVTIIWILIAFTSFKLGLRKYNSGSLMGGRL